MTSPEPTEKKVERKKPSTSESSTSAMTYDFLSSTSAKTDSTETSDGRTSLRRQTYISCAMLLDTDEEAFSIDDYRN